ncbi:hypothetical protein [Sporanaerobacter acetigenes]
MNSDYSFCPKCGKSIK